MWSYQHSVRTSAAPEAIWRLWTDVEHWGDWNAEIEKIELDGPFAAGTEIVMTPPGQDQVRLRLVEVTEPERFVDEADLGDILVRTTHRIEPVGAAVTRVVYRMEITGEAADRLGPQVGPAISADFPQTMAALVRLAER
jgi:uncharacterized protein YndB with AHSA1/START domain